MSQLVLNVTQLTGQYGLRIEGSPSDYNMGYSVSGGKDINNDGIPDIVIGAPQIAGSSTFNSSASGLAYYIFGKSGNICNISVSNLNGKDGFMVTGVVGDFIANGLGRTVAIMKDINGDNIPDSIINYESGLLALYGKNSFEKIINSNSLPVLSYSSAQSKIHNIKYAGDVNNDGKADIVWGVADNLGGEVSIIYGQGADFQNSSSIYSYPGFHIDTHSSFFQNGYGFSFDFAGDLNNDGIDDLLIGANGPFVGGTHFYGAIFAIFGNFTFPFSSSTQYASFDLSTLDGGNGFTFTTISPKKIGTPCAGSRDINGDEIDDITFYVGNGNGALDGCGSINVVFGRNGGFPSLLGPEDLNGQNGFVINSEVKRDDGQLHCIPLSRSVALADINGDSKADIIIGSSLVNGFNSNVAIPCYVVFGKDQYPAAINLGNLTFTDGMIVQDNTRVFDIGVGYSISPNFGESISSTGDFNNDGIEDIIIGAPLTFASKFAQGQGSAYILYGNQNFGKVPSLNFTSNFTCVTSNSSTTSTTAEEFGTSGTTGNSVTSSVSSIHDSLIFLPFTLLSDVANQLKSLFVTEENIYQTDMNNIYFSEFEVN